MPHLPHVPPAPPRPAGRCGGRRAFACSRWAAWLPALAWAYLALARGRFWSARPRLPEPSDVTPPQDWPAVAVVVPARNESELLPRTLPQLLGQDYPGPLHVVVVDDRSSDGTARLARDIGRRARGAGAGPRSSVVEGEPLPPGWAGKPWAMAQGVQVALAASPPPQWMLFTDADIAHPPSSVSTLVVAAQAANRQSLSIMARLSTENGWERLLMPAFVYFFAQIYPFSWVNDRRRRQAAAAGGCFLVDTSALEAAGGVRAIQASVIDDVALARALRRAGHHTWLSLAGRGRPGEPPQVDSLRRYRSLAEIWDMVARSAYTQLRHSPTALAGAVAGLSAIYLAPPVMSLAGLAGRRPQVSVPGLVSWTLMSATYLPMTAYYGTSPWSAPALPFTAALYMAMTLSSARRHRRGRQAWREAGA